MRDERLNALSYEARGLIFDTHNALRVGWPEEAYHQGLIRLLQARNIPYLSMPRKALMHRGVEADMFESDIILDDLLILELKVLPYTKFAGAHFAQIMHYLKIWQYELGLLVNFGPLRAEIKRVVWHEPEPDVFENYDEIRPSLNKAERAILKGVRQSILEVHQHHGLGYPGTTYRRLLAVELAFNGIPYRSDVVVQASLAGQMLSRHTNDHLLVADTVLVSIGALTLFPPKYEFARTKTFLNSLGLRLGLIVNFGKKQLQIYGVVPD